MKSEKWLIYPLIAFTSLTTIGLVYDGSWFGFVRAVISAVILDGLVYYWAEKRVQLRDETQRTTANRMMWVGVFLIALFAMGYGARYVLPVSNFQDFPIAGFEVKVTLDELILYFSSTLVSLWVAVTLAVVLHLQYIDPETKRELEQSKALQTRDEHELIAFKEALKVTGERLGQEKALREFEKHLKGLGVYSPAEIAVFLKDAKYGIQVANGQIPANNLRPEEPNFTVGGSLKKQQN